MMDLLQGRPPMNAGTTMMLGGLLILLAGVLGLLLTHNDLAWSGIVLGAAVGSAGAFKVAAPEGKNQ